MKNLASLTLTAFIAASLCQLSVFARSPTGAPVIGERTISRGYATTTVKRYTTVHGRRMRVYTYYISDESQAPTRWLRVESVDRGVYLLQSVFGDIPPSQRERYALIKFPGTWEGWHEVVFDCKTSEYRRSNVANWLEARKEDIGIICRNFDFQQ